MWTCPANNTANPRSCKVHQFSTLQTGCGNQTPITNSNTLDFAGLDNMKLQFALAVQHRCWFVVSGVCLTCELSRGTRHCAQQRLLPVR